jgi:3-hydroxyacyl-[acyl-carrier-protein] dehydratase
VRYFLVDKVTEIKVGEYAKGVKAITLTDPILHDHFPDYPIIPGALIIEGLAQLAGLILEITFNQSDENIVRAILVQVDKMKFKKPTGPGELLEYTATIDSKHEDAARMTVTAHSNGDLRAKGRITFQMAPINTDNIKKQRQDIYKIWTKELENCPPLR